MFGKRGSPHHNEHTLGAVFVAAALVSAHFANEYLPGLIFRAIDKEVNGLIIRPGNAYPANSSIEPANEANPLNPHYDVKLPPLPDLLE
jgi:hypothetical protein